ncbi:MAG: glycosyltransferase [Blastocatellia bacterium]
MLTNSHYKKDLLFISAFIPSTTSSGSAMRAYQFIKSYSNNYNIYLLVIDFGYSQTELSEEIVNLCSKINIIYISPFDDLGSFIKRLVFKLSYQLFYYLFAEVSEKRFISNKSLKEVLKIYKNQKFEVIHVFKLCLFPYAFKLKEHNLASHLQLDLDDLESLTRNRIAELYKLNSNNKLATFLQKDANLYNLLEKQLLSKFNQLFVCSNVDKQRLITNYQLSNIKVIPNCLNKVQSISKITSSDKGYLLFVGNLAYYPNEDAIKYFVNRIMPLIVKRANKEVTLQIVGGGLNKKLTKEFSLINNIEIYGKVNNLSIYYQNAAVVIAPIRAGGGTRIKIIEAFAYKRPVVTTAIGAEGIEAINGTHLLIADNSEDFANHCLELLNNKQLSEKLVANAFELFSQFYCVDCKG